MIDSTIITGYYFYKGNYYCLLSAVNSKNSKTREWETHVMYSPMRPDPDKAGFCTREISDFNKKFTLCRNIDFQDIEKFYKKTLMKANNQEGKGGGEMRIIIDIGGMDFDEMPEITEEIRRIVEGYEGATMEEE